MIECRGLRVSYGGQRVLDGIDLRIGHGERVALFGLNGAGKTTLLRCLLGLARFEGEVRVDGANPHHTRARERLAYVPQRPPRFDLSVDEFLAGFAELRGCEPARVRERAGVLGLDLAAHGRKRLDELSGGMLQKAVVALALESEAPALLLDEPTANLDAGSRGELLVGLREGAAGRTIVVASHRFEDVVTLAERAVVLAEGKIVFDGPLSELWARGRGGVLKVWSTVSRVDAVQELVRSHPDVVGVHRNGSGLIVHVSDAGAEPRVLEAARRADPEVGF
ncbi:MAG: ABC transporter ATP-binding protein, partial [Gemmatimonadota bacterium]|nr:ABC transporter ATP-binding protein [Gemmatimonadota bacterium]